MVVFDGLPEKYKWGWFAREDPRMHLQPVDREHKDLPYKVWLERDGRKVIEPEPGIPAKVWRPLHSRIVGRRGKIEAYWLSHMMAKGWLELQVINPLVIIIAYPRFPHRFVRTLDLSEDFEPNTLAQITGEEVAFNKELAALEVFPKRPEQQRHHFRLEDILWT